MDRLTSGQHLDELADALGAGFGFLGVPDPVEDGVPIRTRQSCEHRRARGSARRAEARSSGTSMLACPA